MNEAQFTAVVDAVVKELLAAGLAAPRPQAIPSAPASPMITAKDPVDATSPTPAASSHPSSAPSIDSPAEPVAYSDLVIDLPDPATLEARYAPGVKRPKDPEGLNALIAATTSRIGVGRAGPRYTTRALLLFQADHAVTQDALYRAVDPHLLDELGLFTVQTKVTGGKQEYLLRPDLGRQLSDAAKRTITEKCTRGPDIQVVVGDGLSAAAIEANLRQMLPVIRQGVQAAGMTMGTPFFVEFCRVGVMNDIGDLLQPQVLILLIGERPGLGRAESMSAYMAYRPKSGDTDADRDVICNIFEGGGTNPLEAGAYAVQLAQKMRRNQASGVKLKLAS